MEMIHQSGAPTIPVQKEQLNTVDQSEIPVSTLDTVAVLLSPNPNPDPADNSGSGTMVYSGHTIPRSPPGRGRRRASCPPPHRPPS